MQHITALAAQITLNILLRHTFDHGNIIFDKHEDTGIKSILLIHEFDEFLGKFLFVQRISDVMIQLVASFKHNFGLLSILECLRQLLLHILHRGNIVRNQDILVNLPVIIQIRHNRQVQPHRCTVLHVHPDFIAPHPACTHLADDLLHLRVLEILQVKQTIGVADQLRILIACIFTSILVGVGEDPLLREDCHC
ncbi:hypothetical protein D3C80_1381030 [compost metagenome]